MTLSLHKYLEFLPVGTFSHHHDHELRYYGSALINSMPIRRHQKPPELVVEACAGVCTEDHVTGTVDDAVVGIGRDVIKECTPLGR